MIQFYCHKFEFYLSDTNAVDRRRYPDDLWVISSAEGSEQFNYNNTAIKDFPKILFN